MTAKCPTCKNFLLEKRAEFLGPDKLFIARYFCHDCKTVFETLIDKAKEKESNITNLKEWKQNAKQA